MPQMTKTISKTFGALLIVITVPQFCKQNWGRRDFQVRERILNIFELRSLPFPSV